LPKTKIAFGSARLMIAGRLFFLLECIGRRLE
jgi:hypothetical protein